MGNTTKLKVVSITCNTPSENIGGSDFNDEVFLVYQADGGQAFRYPALTEKLEHPYENIELIQPMTTNSVWEPNPELVLEFQYEALLILYDCDPTRIPRYDTYLQSYDYQAGIPLTTSTDPQSVTVLNDNGANYTITT